MRTRRVEWVACLKGDTVYDDLDSGVAIASMAYMKAMGALGAEWGVAGAAPFSSGKRVEQLLQQVRTIVREEVRRGIEESYVRITRHVANLLRQDPEEVIYVPACEALINTSGVGILKFRAVRVFPDHMSGAA